MWPFASRGSQLKTTAPEPDNLPTAEDFEKDDALLRVWLPDVLSDRVNWLSIQLQSSRPDILRALIFEHVYGTVAYEALKAGARKERAAEEVEPRSAAFFEGNSSHKDLAAAWPGTARVKGDIIQSRRRETPIDLEYLGKASDGFKLFLPARLKRDLASIAQEYGLPPSSYVRKLLVQKLLGEAKHTNWQKAIGKISADVEMLERDD